MKMREASLTTGQNRFHGVSAVAMFVVFLLSHVGLDYSLSFPDTRDYLYLREHLNEGVPAWRHAFLNRPVLTGVYLALLQNNFIAALGQSLLGYAAWLYLALAVAALVQQRWWSRIVFIVFLGGALGRQTLFFNVVPASESLSLSCLCLLLGAMLNWAAGRGRLATVAAAALLLVMSRDIWNYLLLLLAPMLLLLPAMRNTGNGKSWQVTLLLLVVAACGLWGANKGERHIIPLKHAITHYVIGDADAIAFFAQRGLTLPEAQQRQCRQQTYKHCVFEASQELWLREQGKSTYQSWLLHTLPRRTLDWAFALPDALSRDLIPYIWSARNGIYGPVSLVLPIGHINFFYLSLLGVSVIVVSISVVAAGHVLSLRQQLLAQMGAAIALSGVALLFVSYWGDGVEVWRHLLLPAVLCSLGGWLVLCAQIDALIGRVAQSRT